MSTFCRDSREVKRSVWYKLKVKRMGMLIVICLSMTVSSLACIIENSCSIKSAPTCGVSGVWELVNGTSVCCPGYYKLPRATFLCQECPNKKFMSSYNLCCECDDCKECMVNTNENQRCSRKRDTICEGDQTTTTPPPNCTTPTPRDDSTTTESTTSTSTSNSSSEPINKPRAYQSSRCDLAAGFYIFLALFLLFLALFLLVIIVPSTYLWCISSHSAARNIRSCCGCRHQPIGNGRDNTDNGAQRDNLTWTGVLQPVADKVFCYKDESP